MRRQEIIEQTLSKTLTPTHLSVENESRFHHVPDGSETHFKVTLVSDSFAGQTLVSRHRMVNQLLKGEFDTGLHALSLHLFTPEEWEKRQQNVLKSPGCRDGFKK